MKLNLLLCLVALSGCTVAEVRDEVKPITVDAYVSRVKQTQQNRYVLRGIGNELKEQVARDCKNNAVNEARDTGDLTKADECLQFIEKHMPALATQELYNEVRP
ncbi:MAG: hypothetical protein V7776_04915 [Halopseudomonas aestusnigri]